MPVIPAVLILAGLLAVASFLAFFIHKGKRNNEPFPQALRKNISSDEPQEAKERVLLLFGTQTGTAERFCKQLKQELSQRYGDALAYDSLDIEEYDHEAGLQKEKLVFLLLATYGDGEPTDNAATFYSWIVKASNDANKGDGESILQGVHFGVFSLGNKQYEHFCAVGKRVEKAMLSLGASAVVERGDGDDDEDIEADFDHWRQKLYTALDASELVPKPSHLKGMTAVMHMTAAESVASYEVEVLGDGGLERSPTWDGDGSSARLPFASTVVTRRELHTPHSDRSCLHVELDFQGSQVTYEAGDHVGILAQNEADVVERAAAALGVSPALTFSLSCSSGNPHQLPNPFQGPVTLREALAWHTDLLSPVAKPQLQALAAFAKGEDAKKLRFLLSPEGQEEYKAWQCHSRSLLETLEEFPAIQPPLGAFFGAIAGRLQVRFYSISSSPKVQDSVVHVTCSVVAHPTATGRLHRGIVSHQLQRCKPGDKIPAFIRRSTFKLPRDPAAPLLMIGPGTGLAPFRGFLQERRALAASGARLGAAHLFFGCRNRKHDYIYEQELSDLKAQGGYTHLHTAFSREGPSKVYVQHHIASHAAELWELILGGGYVYVCGEAKKMAKDVHKALLHLAASAPEGAEKFIAGLTSSGRYQKDVW